MAKKYDIIIIVDVEATCWEGKTPADQSSDIIEVGLATLDLATLEILEKRAILVRPERSTVSPFCTELTTLTQEQLDAEGVTFKEACAIIRKEYEAPSRLWGSWGDYDRRQFERECREKNIGYPFGSSHLNIKSLFSMLNGWTREIGMAGGLEALGIPLEGTHHRGVDDAYNIARVLAHMLGKYPRMLPLQDA